MMLNSQSCVDCVDHLEYECTVCIWPISCSASSHHDQCHLSCSCSAVSWSGYPCHFIIIVIMSLYHHHLLTLSIHHYDIMSSHHYWMIIILNIDHRQLMKMIIVMTTAGVNVNCWTRHTLPSHCQQFARDSAVSGKVSQDHCTDVHNWFIHTEPNIILSLLHEDNTTGLRDNTAWLTVLQTIRLHDSQIKRLKMINWFTLLLLSFTGIFLLLPTSCVQ